MNRATRVKHPLIKVIRTMAVLLAALLGTSGAYGQRVAAKTNLLSDAVLLSPNLGVEVGVAPKWTVDLSGQLCLWGLNGDKRWKHWLLQPEARYWLCQRFSGHFFGVEGHFGQFNIGGVDIGINFLGTDLRKLKDRRYQGWQGGAGLTYGYAWIVAEHWNVEAEIGVGYSYMRYDSFPCASCGTKLSSGATHNYFGLTKAQLALTYVF